MGAAGVRRRPRGAARRGDLPPGEPRAPGPGGDASQRRRRAPRHARRDRLPHDDDQRARRARVGRGRHRGRGRDARPADVPAARRSSSACGSRGALPAGHHRDRPGAHAHPDAPRARGGRPVRRVLRRRAARRSTLADRATLSNMCPEYGATSAYFPVDDETLALPRGSPAAATASTWSSATRRSRGCSVATATPTRRSPRSLDLDLAAVEPSVAGPKRPQDRVALARRVGLVRRGVPRPARARPRGDRGRPASSPRAGTPRSRSTADETVEPGPEEPVAAQRRRRPSRLGRDRRDHVAARTRRTPR